MQAQRLLLPFTFCFAALAVTQHVHAWTEDFNGSFSKVWNASTGAFPNENIWTFGDYGSVGTVVYSGNAPDGGFETIGPDQVYRMTTAQGPLDRSAMVSDDVLSGTEGYVEARFNTVTQDSQHIDQLVDLWLLNASDPTQYVRVGLFGSDFSTNRGWSFASSTDGSAFFGGVNYANDTWYRARIVASATDLRVSIFNDAGNVEHVGYTFSHTLASLGSSFRIGIGQFMGGSGGEFINDVGVDYITTTIPEPATMSIAGLIFGAAMMRRSRMRRSL